MLNRLLLLVYLLIAPVAAFAADSKAPEEHFIKVDGLERRYLLQQGKCVGESRAASEIRS